MNAKVYYASRDGWILLEKYYFAGRLFFFNPSTIKVIYLPSLDSGWFEFATFSLAPVSPTCFVFSVEKWFNRYYIHVYSHADKRWKIHRLISSKYGHNLGTMSGICYVEGTRTIYCCFSSFYVVTFNVASREPNLVVTAYPALDYPFLTELYLSYLLG